VTVYDAGFLYVVLKGWPTLLGEFGWAWNDEH